MKRLGTLAAQALHTVWPLCQGDADKYYDLAINYFGHTIQWDGIEIDGSLERHNCTVRYRRGGRVLAVATISRNRENMEAELAMERELARP